MADLKALAQSFYDDIGDKDVAVDALVDKYIAEDFVEHEALPDMDNTRETPRQMFNMMRAGSSDLRMNVADMVQEDDKVVCGTMTGTHDGEFMGVPASGNKLDASFIDILRFRDDKCVEHWGVTDLATLMQQVGAKG